MRQSSPTPHIDANLEGETLGQVIVGNNNIQILADHGGKVSVVVSGERTTPHSRSVPVCILPRRFSGLLDRQSEIDSAISTLQSGLPVEFYGEEGSGKTSLLRNIAHHPDANSLRDGIVCVSAAGLAAEDLSQELLCVFFDLDDNSFKPTVMQFCHLMQDKKALILLDDVELTREELERLMMALPNCTFVATSRERHLWGEGRSMAVSGLPAREALELFERELGRSLADDERASAETLCADLSCNPMLILRAAALAREEQRSITSMTRWNSGIAPAKELIDEAITHLNESEQQMLAALAALDGTSIHTNHLAAITGVADAQAVLDRLQRRSLVQAHELRYSLSSDVTDVLQRAWNLTPWSDRVLAYFLSWTKENKRAHKDVLEVTIPIQAILKWAVEAGQWEEVIKLGRAVEDALILGGRWDAWENTLQLMLKAGRTLGRISIVGFALHQLGTRALGLGEKSTAESYLKEALNIRKSLGDEPGAAVTRNNLDIMFGPPLSAEPSQLRKAGTPRPKGAEKLLKLVLIPSALLLIGGLAGWYVLSRDGKRNYPGGGGDAKSLPVPQLRLPAMNGQEFCSSGEGQKQVQLEWSVAEGVSVIKSYEIQVEGGPQGSIMRSSDTDSLKINLPCEHAYRWSVRALDEAGNAGNWAEKSGFAVKTLPPDVPGISRFTATPDSIVIGEKVKLCFGVVNVSRAQVEPSIGNVKVSGNNCIDVAPKDTTTYTLIATNDSGKEARQKTIVTVRKPEPEISFSVDKQTIVRDDKVTLYYEVKYATRVRIEPVGLTKFPLKDSVIVKDNIPHEPKQTTIYTLTATGYDDRPYSQQVKVNVVDRVEIIHFRPKPEGLDGVLEGSKVEVCYVVRNATEVRIEPYLGPITSLEQGCFTHVPQDKTTYTLTAAGYNGHQVQRSFSITAMPSPKIITFKANRYKIQLGESVELYYEVVNAFPVTIRSSSKELDKDVDPDKGVKRVLYKPKETTTYTLIAGGIGNSQASATLTVEVELPAPVSLPVIVSFAASPNPINRGQKTALSYSVTGATSVKLDHGVGLRNNAQKDEFTVSPEKTTTYVLTAANGAGSVSESVTVDVRARSDDSPTPPPVKDEEGWCCERPTRVGRIFGSFSLASQRPQQPPCRLTWTTERDCKSLKGRIFLPGKTEKEARRVCCGR